jgi:hypothetical protein
MSNNASNTPAPEKQAPAANPQQTQSDPKPSTDKPSGGQQK